MVLCVGRRVGVVNRRRSAGVVALVVPGVAFLVAGAGSYPQATSDVTPCCAEVVTSAPALAAAMNFVEPLAAVPRVVPAGGVARGNRVFLPAGVAPENGLQVKTILAARVISALFPEIRNIGGVRPDSLRWHPNGLALDVMIPDYHSAAGIELGDRVTAYALENAARLGVDHVIWRQTLHMPSGATRMMSDYGSDDANHYTHVHIATDGGGYPTGNETYFTSTEGPAVSEGSSSARMATLIGNR